MSDLKRQQRKVFTELTPLLTPPIIRQLENALDIPARIRENTKCDPIKFLLALKEWEHFDPAFFDRALQNVGGNIVQTARKLEWLSVPSYKPPVTRREPKTMKRFVQLLTEELTSKEWLIVSETSEEAEPKQMLKQCLNKEIITTDMVALCEMLEDVKRNDLAGKVEPYMKAFEGMSSAQFHEQINRELESGENEDHDDWLLELKRSIRKQNKDVTVILDKDTEPSESDKHRPGAWSEVLYEHGREFKIDTNFQVLGFSPENRDLYFEKRIETPEKLSSVREMFYRHDEINQLALVPVNASLFCALFNESDSILSTTLSHLYTQLIVYLIRRQLSRIGLEEHSKVLLIPDFHPAIRECIYAIGLEANQGIFERELTSDKNISFTIGDKVYPSDRLGLMQCHLKEVNLSTYVRVWTFQHLTVQEYMAALSICNNSWKNQCYIIRYFTASTRYLSMYKMVIRFVCGILKRDAGCITPILCRHTIPKPMSFIEVPMYHQLCYDHALVQVSDWIEFTQSYIQLTTTIIETKSEAITDHFAYFERHIPFPLYLYFQSSLAPNDWHCFLLSLEFIHDFQLIEIQSDFVSATQFQSLLTRIPSCHIRYLALTFVEDDFDTIYSYARLFSSATLPRDTKISIHLQSCDLSACLPSQHLFPETNPFAGSLKISESDMTADMLQDLTNQFSLIENLDYRPNPDSSHWSIIEQLALSHQFNGLYCTDTESDVTVTPATLSNLSSLTELYVSQNEDVYELIPSLLHLTSLSVLDLFNSIRVSSNHSVHSSLSQLISNNFRSLRQLYLTDLHRVGFDSWSSYFSCVTSCTNLIVLALSNTEFSSVEIGCWYRASSALSSLAYLYLTDIPLQDSGMLVLCHSLSYHPAIRLLKIWKCELSSVSCVPLMCLIQTLKTVRTLELYNRELSSPDPEQLQLLAQTAVEYSVKIDILVEESEITESENTESGSESLENSD